MIKKKNIKIIKPITEITDNKIGNKCSTKTFVSKIPIEKSVVKKTLEDLKFILPGCYTTKFRNCVIKKIDKKSIKLYTNMTLQISGISSKDDLLEIFKLINLDVEEYNIKCVMSNWTIKISDKPINLIETMNKLNNNNIIAYFLRGYPLVIKYKSFDYSENYILKKTNDNTLKSVNYTLTDFKTEKEEIEVSVLMFKSGNCIISGKLEKPCAECIIKLKKYLVFFN